MNEIAIRARRLTKAYRLYDSPAERTLDLFGLLPNAKKKARHHVALNDVNFDIHRGEKIGIVGRNGAGKSTLLKLVTRVTEPTSGILEVHGQSRALLQIGTGFHPDFTGRQNVSAYLASLGVGAREAEPLIEDAIAFAELEDFADQPVKTYSTGMSMRLMFAASTMMKPDLLIIDEVLGVGDAYFQRKSFERIREMCENRETTLLLVSHDVYSVSALCDRMIWIDRGRILIDADPPTVTRAYEDAMREQEERRLRAKALGYAGERGGAARRERVIVEIQSKHNQPPPCPVWFSRITLMSDGVPIASLRFDEDAFQDRDGVRLQREGCNWSEPRFVDGRMARALATHGSPFHKVAGVFTVDATSEGPDPGAFSVVLDYKMEASAALRMTLTAPDWRLDLGELPAASGVWRDHHAVASVAAPDAGYSGCEADFKDWQSWIVASSGAMIDIAGDTLELGWGGPAGPYLMMTPPIPVHAGETLFAPVSVAVRSGRLGFGALGADGQWLRTYEFDAAQDARTLEFTAAEDGALTLVLYSAAPEPLSARVTHGVGAAADAAVNTKGVYGAGDIRMEGFRVFDHDGRETLILPVGQPARFEIDYRIVRPGLRERAQVLLAFQRNGVQDVFRVMQKDFLFDYDESQTGTLSVALDPLPIAPGTYSIALLIGAEGYYDRPQPLYFTINPEVYFMQPKAVEIEVVGSHLAYVGTGVIGYGKWCASLSHAVEAAE